MYYMVQVAVGIIHGFGCTCSFCSFHLYDRKHTTNRPISNSLIMVFSLPGVCRQNPSTHCFVGHLEIEITLFFDSLPCPFSIFNTTNEFEAKQYYSAIIQNIQSFPPKGVCTDIFKFSNKILFFRIYYRIKA